GGMIHISDLSWVKRFNHPSDFTKVGQTLDVVVLGVDKDTRKLSLGHKQIEEDPWTTFETVFPIGSIHDGVMIRKEEKGGIIQLQYGLEAFAPTRHLRKEDEKMIAVDETNQFMILEFDRSEKRIMVSHSKVWEQRHDEERDVARKEANSEAESTKKAVKNIQTKVEKATLGDIGALADLKKKMEGNEGA
ncbi:MAG TPA: S1 RNA-binding domain-containing protein, partial [Chitinophagaceae bacterium]|nr:S1 RNA-binding domain-containing protein [Chitinophagaceae bacterium]